MTQEPLLYIEGATEASTQWKIDRLHMVNWGGFHGSTTVAFSPSGTLISGASGTGKSTLLDAYIALMMPSGTPFNGASNDATTGRARSAEQRNLLTYLRGKTDDSRETGTGELRDEVLRGANSSTWGALAATFIDDHNRTFTAARFYFVSRGATRDADITTKLVTTNGALELTEWAEVANTRFDKRAIKTRFTQVAVHDTYGNFAQTLYTRLGIGANGDGGKALRLLARIQAGQQVRTVDDLYKSMVLEDPATFDAADKAVNHFIDLEASYNEMQTLADKERVLRPLPELNLEREAATKAGDLIDTFGIHRDGDTPFLLWKLTTHDRLLEAAEQANGEARRDADDTHRAAKVDETRLEALLGEVRDEKREAGGDILKRLDEDIRRRRDDHDTAERARVAFDTRTLRLDLGIDSADEFAAAQTDARTFLDGFPAALDAVTAEQNTLGLRTYPLQIERDELREEAASFKGRQGRVPRELHEARLKIADATGLLPSELPFVAELIDLQPAENRWRKAIEVTLHGLARVMLIDRNRLDHLSRSIDHLDMRRVNFHGVSLRTYDGDPGLDPDRISGKLQYKDSPFSAWVQDRISGDAVDAICVDSPSELGGRERRVTVNGQTRQGDGGAHGHYNSPHIIGFSSRERLEEIAAALTRLDTELGDLGRQHAVLQQRITELHTTKSAQETVRDTTWADIDTATISRDIDDLLAQHARILEGNDRLQALEAEETRLGKDLETARSRKHIARNALDGLAGQLDAIISAKDTGTRHLDRINANGAVTLTDDQTARLDAEFEAICDPLDRTQFTANTDRLRRRLADQSSEARNRRTSAEKAMTNLFQNYQQIWADPNLGIAIDSYDGYRAILDDIVTVGLAERRAMFSRELSEWSGEDLVPLAGAFEESISDIETRLEPINTILSTIPFGDRHDHLKIDLRRLHRDDIARFKRELNLLSAGATTDFSDTEITAYFKRLQVFMGLIRHREAKSKTGNRDRNYFLDVRKHVVITAVAVDTHGIERSTYAALGGKSGGETQELVAFVVGAALRFQLGDETSARPRFAPVFLDEGFVKSDSEFAGRAVEAWKKLGFQLIIGAPFDKVTALEPHMDRLLAMSKNATGYSFISPLIPKTSPEPASDRSDSHPVTDASASTSHGTGTHQDGHHQGGHHHERRDETAVT